MALKLHSFYNLKETKTFVIFPMMLNKISQEFQGVLLNFEEMGCLFYLNYIRIIFYIFMQVKNALKKIKSDITSWSSSIKNRGSSVCRPQFQKVMVVSFVTMPTWHCCSCYLRLPLALQAQRKVCCQSSFQLVVGELGRSHSILCKYEELFSIQPPFHVAQLHHRFIIF